MVSIYLWVFFGGEMDQHNSRCGMPAALEMKIPSEGCAEVRAVRAKRGKTITL